VDEQSIRSVIDEIALQVAVYDSDRDFRPFVADKTMEYVTTLRERQPGLSEPELHRIAAAIVNGVLTRLMEIAERAAVRSGASAPLPRARRFQKLCFALIPRESRQRTTSSLALCYGTIAWM
jgi:hypothetical protein